MKISTIKEFDGNDEDQKMGNVQFPETAQPRTTDIDYLFSKYKRGKILLQPSFQRKYIWNQSKQKALIKSLYCGIPLPTFYFSTNKNNIDEVVDGQQRLTTIFGFLELSSLPNDIRPKIHSRIKIKTKDNTIINIKKIKDRVKTRLLSCVNLPNTSIGFKYEVFKMLNQGSATLKPHEIRNCIFEADFPELNRQLKQMAEKIRKLTNLPLERMMGEELAFRFCIIQEYNYDKSPVTYMEKFQNEYKKYDAEKLKSIKTKWNKFINHISWLFGEDSAVLFQVFRQDVKQPNSLNWKTHTFTGKINQGLFHLLSYYLPKYDKHKISKVKIRKVRDGYLKLLKTKKFTDVITGSGTNSVRKIKKANDYFKKVFLDEYIGDWTLKQKRSVSAQEKRTIFNNVPYCYLCYGKLKNNITLSQIHAEHIEPYSTGKQSKFCNILLAHPKCNHEKSASSFEDYRMQQESIKRRSHNKKNIDEYLQCLTRWNKEYPLGQYFLLRRSALKDKKYF